MEIQVIDEVRSNYAYNTKRQKYVDTDEHTCIDINLACIQYVRVRMY